MQDEAVSVFVREVLPFLVVPAAICFALIWLPWRRWMLRPKDPRKVEAAAQHLLVAGNRRGAIALFESSYGLSPSHAEAIISSLEQNMPSK